ncbi:MAG: DMT family transporter [Sphingomonadales bacterium]
MFSSIPKHWKGPLWMVWSCLLFVIIWGLIRVASEDLHPFVIVFFRTLFAVLAFAPFLLRHGWVPLKTKNIKLHALRGIFSFFGTLGLFYAVAHVPLADVVAISYSAPVFAAAGVILILGEKVHFRRIAAILIGFIGVLVVLRPGFREIDLGVISAVGGSLALAGSLVVIKLLSGKDRPEAIALYSFLFVLPASLIGALFFWKVPTLSEFLILIAIGILVALGHTALARAFRYSEATAVLPLDFTRMVFASILGVLAFGESLDYIAWIGGGVILTATVYVAHREATVKKHRP